MQLSNAKQQNNCLNFVKGCACFGILYMHTGYDFLFSSVIACLSRFAVPVFFMISGYYCYNEDRNIVNRKLPGKIKHISKLCLIATVVYFVWSAVCVPLLSGNMIDIRAFIIHLCIWKNWVNFIFFNQILFGGTLWFLFALLYCYLIFWIVNKKNCYKAAYISIPVLIVLHIMSRGIIQYFNLIDENINIVFYRNFIFLGFPFFMMGNFIHRNEESLLDRFSNKRLFTFIVAGLAISCAERLIVPLELYWGTVMATFCIFVFAIKNPERTIIPIVADIGEKYSMPIYILHPIVSALIYYIKCAIGIEESVILAILNPVIVFATIPIGIKMYETVRNKLCKEVLTKNGK